MPITKEHEEAVDNAIAELLGHATSVEEANEALLNCFSSPILCLVAASFKQGQGHLVPAVIQNCASQAMRAVATCVAMHQRGDFDRIEKEGKH